MWAKTALLSLLAGAALAAPLASDAFAQGRHRGGGYERSVEPNYAQPRREFRGRDDDRRQQAQQRISVREAAERVRNRFGGELISASLEGGTYVLRWRFPNQMVEDIRVDAVSGQVYR